MGYHEVAGPRPVDVLLPVRHPGWVQPLRGGMDGRPPGVGRVGQTAAGRKLPETEDCERATYAPCGPGIVDEVQMRRHVLSDRGVTKTHSRPYVSNDHPFSESRFKTLKYRPQFPQRFGSLEEARAFCQNFFAWYNTEHRHSGIGLLTPEIVHYGLAEPTIAVRQGVLDEASKRHPERLVKPAPQAPALPEAVWIHPPEKKDATESWLVNLDMELSQSA